MENIYFEEDSKRLTKEVWSHLNKGITEVRQQLLCQC